MKLSELIQRTISLSARIRAARTAELAQRDPDKLLICAAEEFGPPPPETHELRALLRRQPAATIYMMTCVMYLGRGDYDATDLMHRYEHMSDTFHKPVYAVEQMIGKNPLAEYLQDGLAQLHQAGIDVDSLLESGPR